MSDRLRVLHLGTGFRPLRRGGLVAYVEDVVAEQARRGHDVAYLFAGRQYRPGRPRLRRWEHGGVPMLEIVDSPLFDHGRQPELEVSEPRVEAIVERVVRERCPDVVHVHELAGLPSSVLDAARVAGARVVLTLQDYFALCPAFKLRAYDGATCLRTQLAESCPRTLAADARDPALLFEATLRHDLHVRGRRVPRRARWWLDRRVPAAARMLARRAATPASPGEAYQRRRESNLARLNRLDAVIAMSDRVAELHATLGVDPDRLVTMRLTLAHIERLRPRAVTAEPPLTFATLGGGESEAKGAGILLDAWRALGADRARARLLLFGHVAPAVAARAGRLEGVELRPPFTPGELDALLDEVDVGIVPSVWEEAYGYAGIELLAKGIPVVANAIGALPEYVRPGSTGWLNESCDAAGLAAILRELVADTGAVARLAAQVRARRADIVVPMGRHADELEAVYATGSLAAG